MTDQELKEVSDILSLMNGGVELMVDEFFEQIRPQLELHANIVRAKYQALD